MPRMSKSISRWGQPDFTATFIAEASALPAHQLPLQRAMSVGNMVTDDAPQIMVNASYERDDRIVVRTGVFFSSIIAGCSCADDPTPVDINSEYCELEFTIDRSSAETSITISD